MFSAVAMSTPPVAIPPSRTSIDGGISASTTNTIAAPSKSFTQLMRYMVVSGSSGGVTNCTASRVSATASVSSAFRLEPIQLNDLKSPRDNEKTTAAASASIMVCCLRGRVYLFCL